MKIARVDPIAVKVGRPTQSYKSFEAAITAATNHPLQSRAKADGKRFSGRQFVGGRASLTRWSLEFTGPLWIDIWAEADEVKWEVLESPMAFESIGEPIPLLWTSDLRSVTDPARLVADRVGADFWQFFVNDHGFFVYLRRKLILYFHTVRREDDESCILYVGEEV